MGKQQILSMLGWLAFIFAAFGCNTTPPVVEQPPAATVDLVATEVAVQQAAAATLTAVAQAASEVPPTATDTPPPTATPPAADVSVDTPTPAPTPTATDPPPPTPTPPLLVLVPVDGGREEGGPDGQMGIPGLTPDQLRSARFDEITFKDRIVFQTLARVPEVGEQDGAGIDNIHFTITYDDNGNQVFENTEENPAYCVFGGGEPDCSVLFFDQANNRWPGNGPEIVNGYFTTRMEVRTVDDVVETWVWRFRVERYGIYAEIVQTGPNSDDFEVEDELVFQVEAFDPRQGYRDGDGINRVDFFIIDQNSGQQVYSHTEQNAGFCAFEGGEPDCNVFDFQQYNGSWPDGPPLEEGSYLLRAVVHAGGGRTAVVEREIELFLD
jgi:hypothetical protein